MKQRQNLNLDFSLTDLTGLTDTWSQLELQYNKQFRR